MTPILLSDHQITPSGLRPRPPDRGSVWRTRGRCLAGDGGYRNSIISLHTSQKSDISRPGRMCPASPVRGGVTPVTEGLCDFDHQITPSGLRPRPPDRGSVWRTRGRCLAGDGGYRNSIISLHTSQKSDISRPGRMCPASPVRGGVTPVTEGLCDFDHQITPSGLRPRPPDRGTVGVHGEGVMRVTEASHGICGRHGVSPLTAPPGSLGGIPPTRPRRAAGLRRPFRIPGRGCLCISSRAPS